MAQLRCTVTTPEKTELDIVVDSVTLPLYDGQMGIYPGHSPMIGRLGYGLLEVKSAGKNETYYVDGGFVQVTGDSVAVLTDRMQNPNTINASDAEEELRTALALPSSQPAAAAIKNKAVSRARARKHVRLAAKAPILDRHRF